MDREGIPGVGEVALQMRVTCGLRAFNREGREEIPRRSQRKSKAIGNCVRVALCET